jgi:hypothetical protein
MSTTLPRNIQVRALFKSLKVRIKTIPASSNVMRTHRGNFLLDGVNAVSVKTGVAVKESMQSIGFQRIEKVTLGVWPKDLVRAEDTLELRLSRSLRLKDFFVRTLLWRFLIALLGSNVTLCFLRNLQKELTINEAVFVKLQQHRIFLMNPTPLRTQKQKDKYQ